MSNKYATTVHFSHPSHSILLFQLRDGRWIYLTLINGGQALAVSQVFATAAQLHSLLLRPHNTSVVIDFQTSLELATASVLLPSDDDSDDADAGNGNNDVAE